MPREIPSIRILPMSDRIEGFRGRAIEDVQRNLFLRDLPAGKGRFHYRASGLNAPRGTIVLFQFRARIIASATFVRDERFDRPKGAISGVLHFEPSSIRSFGPIDAQTMRQIWPGFRSFGHVKQRLNPTCYVAFTRRRKALRMPATYGRLSSAPVAGTTGCNPRAQASTPNTPRKQKNNGANVGGRSE